MAGLGVYKNLLSNNKKKTTNSTTTTNKTNTSSGTSGSSGSSYSANTNWDNEKAYLTNLAQNGTAGEQAWANNQLGVLANAQAQYSPTSVAPVVTPSVTTNSQYTAKGTYNDAGISAWAQNQINAYKNQYNEAMAKGDTEAAAQAHALAEAIRQQYGYSGGADGSDYIALPQNLPFEYVVEQPTYESKYDPQIDALLNQILNREDFSYDVTKDPLYQQYAQMYQREGDRAMRDTMAEAAASAGGMNTYAMTAASQANNYYASQLNDKIPELYQLAYGMYLDGIDQKIQDLGLLQNMDATQYNRYRDTMNDWREDKNFAYGMYRDNIGDSQWQQNFDYNAGRDNVYDSQWQQEYDYKSNWADKEWDYQTQKDAQDRIDYYIENGVTTIPSELLEKSGMTQEEVNLLIAAAHEAEKAKTTNSQNYKVIYSDDDKRKKAPEGEEGDWTEVLTDLGLDASVGVEEIERLYNAGAIYEDANGKVKWKDGWSASNYQLRFVMADRANSLNPFPYLELP